MIDTFSTRYDASVSLSRRCSAPDASTTWTENVSSLRRTPRISRPSFVLATITCGGGAPRPGDMGADGSSNFLRSVDDGERPAVERSGATIPPRPLIWWQSAQRALPKNNASPALASPATLPEESATFGEPLRVRMYETSCQTCWSVRLANGGICVPGTPARIAWKRSASPSPCAKRPVFRAGPRSPCPAGP